MPEPTSDAVAKVAALADRHTPEIVRFLREMIAIPSESARSARSSSACAPRWSASASTRSRSTASATSSAASAAARSSSRSTATSTPSASATARPGRATPTAARSSDGIVYGRGAGDQEGGFAAAVYGAAHRQGARPARRRPALGHRHRDGGGLRRPLLAVHPAREGAAARRRRHHRADQPRRLPRPARAHGDGGAHAGALGARLDARARRQRGLQDGADRRRHRAAEPAPRPSGPTPSSARAR